MVVGDVNSTIACALTACKLRIKVAHVEAGLRSFDRTMPEEINRLLTDQISDLLFTTHKEANKNLIKEGIPKSKIFCIGDVMIDTLFYQLQRIKRLKPVRGQYALLTLHRPGNVDNPKSMRKIFHALNQIAATIPIIFPVHPRTKKQMKRFNIHCHSNIKLLPPLGYLDFIKLYPKAKLILTDSGSIQIEASVLNIPCLTLRENTERPFTVTHGTNVLVGTNEKKIFREALKILNGKRKQTRLDKMWDGKASERITNKLTATI